MKNLLAAAAVALTLTACGTHYATTKATATIKEGWHRDSILKWGGARVFAYGPNQIGYDGDAGKRNYTFDAGSETLRVWFFANRNGFKGAFTLTDVVDMPVTLEPGQRYELRAAESAEAVKFSLVNLGNGQAVASTGDVPVKLGPSPLPVYQGPIYIYMPAR